MGLDVATGTVTFDDGTVLRPRLPRADAPGDGTRTLDGTAFHCRLVFDRDELARVLLTATSVAPRDVAAARAVHDPWLAERLGAGRAWQGGGYPFGGVEYRYPWGTVGSYAIPQDHAAYVEVAYR